MPIDCSCELEATLTAHMSGARDQGVRSVTVCARRVSSTKELPCDRRFVSLLKNSLARLCLAAPRTHVLYSTTCQNPEPEHQLELLVQLHRRYQARAVTHGKANRARKARMKLGLLVVGDRSWLGNKSLSCKQQGRRLISYIRNALLVVRGDPCLQRLLLDNVRVGCACVCVRDSV